MIAQRSNILPSQLDNLSTKESSGMEKVLFVDFPEEQQLERRFYSKKELCDLYCISKNTLAAYIGRFKRDFEAIGYNKYRKKLTIAEVQLLCSLIGFP